MSTHLIGICNIRKILNTSCWLIEILMHMREI